MDPREFCGWPSCQQTKHVPFLTNSFGWAALHAQVGAPLGNARRGHFDAWACAWRSLHFTVSE
eukprot:7639512-Alexandrium_andersonii.AAC.1